MNLRKWPLVVIGLIIILTVHVHATNQFQHLTTSDGLAGPLVRDIAQDKNGFLWFATAYGLSRYDGYKFKNFYHNKDDRHSLSSNNLWKLHFDDNDNLWVVSSLGIDRFNGINFDRYLIDTDRITSIESINSRIIIGTNNGIYQANFNSILNNYEIELMIGNVYVNDLYKNKNGNILAATNSGIFRLQSTVKQLSKLEFLHLEGSAKFKKLFSGKNNTLLASTDNKLFSIDLEKKSFYEVYPSISKHFIQSIAFDENLMVIGTRHNGLYKIIDDLVFHYQYQPTLKRSLSENIITSVYFDKDKTLWVGTFSSGLNFQNDYSQHFGLNQSQLKHLKCLNTSTVNAILELSSNDLLLGTNSGLFRIKNNESCEKLRLLNGENLVQPRVYAILRESEDTLLVGLSNGVARYNLENASSRRLFQESISSSVYYLKGNSENLFLGTFYNTFYYNRESETLHELKFNNESIGSHQADFINDSMPVFATNEGLFTQSSALKLVRLNANSKEMDNLSIATITITEQHIWMANDYNKAIYKLDLDGNVLNRYRVTNENKSIRFMSAESSGKYLWISSSDGLFRLNKEDEKIDSFSITDGLQSDNFVRNSSLLSKSGRLFFGGTNGYNAFFPTKISSNQRSPKVVLTEMRHFNTIVKPSSPQVQKEKENQFKIDRPIEKLTHLNLSYKDYIVSFEFAALSSLAPNRNRYRYKLEGFHQDWIDSDASDRKATLTNLNAGNYRFIVQGANKDGVWSTMENSVDLLIKVNPAPWLTWWAFTLYIILFFTAIFAFIYLKIRKEVLRANELEVKVQQRTREIIEKKNLIETLLEQKNQQFANISHEFRTPLTLILGPLEKELQDLNAPKNQKHLAMIERNSIRLYGMVEQILRLTELKKEQRINKASYSINTVINLLVELFKPLLDQKNLNLTLKLSNDCTILAAEDALEIIFGNLISNAIKYTPANGLIEITTIPEKEAVHILITDNGIGIDEHELDTIFKPYTRSDRALDLDGNGLGLSIVKELVESHVGSIQVESTVNHGTSFKVTLPTTPYSETNININSKTIQHLFQSNDFVDFTKSNLNNDQNLDEQRDLVLIIEDNRDMREYLNEIIGADYETILAENGNIGVDLALENIPDLIVCDLMMPGIDGYEVVRSIRNDEKTSHIPIMLLTAKGDKQSRILGWDENIDDYMTKPFDETELLARVNSIISIRNILRNKAFSQRQNSKSITGRSPGEDELEKDTAILKPKEQLFVDKLMALVKENFSKSHFQRSDLAKGLAVSERQLHRKVKALLNQNPIEILRDYRLEISMSYLKDGEQVSNVADMCGFSSPSYFSQCFKARYGISPKEIN
ncbi:MAG: response regulator [Gammaproteobacteria bacterium]|nr:response regulator [Gammaproteobacteria bacterium]